MRRTLRSTFAAVASAAVAALVLALGAAPASAALRFEARAVPAYFEMTDATHRIFVVELTDPGAIEHARRLLAGWTRDSPHLVGRIAGRPAAYNPMWRYHFDSGTVRFSDRAIEACDATIPYLQHHLDEAGDAFLPGLVWCDGSSRLVRELPWR